MSLLIDALKQAEAARAQAQSGESVETPQGIELEPLAEKAGSPVLTASKPRDGMSSTPPRPTRQSPALQTQGTVASDAARELFEVKRLAPNRMPLILAAVGILVFVCGAGYVWWAMQPHSSLLGPGFNANQAPSNEALAVMQPVPIHESSSSAASSVDLSPPAPAAQAATQQPRDLAATTPSRRARREMFGGDSSLHKRKAEAVPADDTSPQIRSGATNNPDASGAQAAYAAFLEGNYSLARQRYQEVLREDPHNVDAMNALGLIAWRSGQPDAAERMFRAAAHADPKDATAISQLALLYSEGDPTGAESRLRNLIASQPAAGAPYYALGSLLARQQRWSEAQQALFQAYTLDSDNPDVLFNLAICLEHLAQPAAARQFYERALQAAARRPAGFDKSVAQDRVQTLGTTR